jgi:nucleoid DNA-binding protein
VSACSKPAAAFHRECRRRAGQGVQPALAASVWPMAAHCRTVGRGCTQRRFLRRQGRRRGAAGAAPAGFEKGGPSGLHPGRWPHRSCSMAPRSACRRTASAMGAEIRTAARRRWFLSSIRRAQAGRRRSGLCRGVAFPPVIRDLALVVIKVGVLQHLANDVNQGGARRRQNSDLFEKVGLNKREAKDMVEAFFEEIRTALERGDSVKLSGFGNFQLRDKPQRPGAIPRPAKKSRSRPAASSPSTPARNSRPAVESNFPGTAMASKRRTAADSGQALLHHR